VVANLAIYVAPTDPQRFRFVYTVGKRPGTAFPSNMNPSFCRLFSLLLFNLLSLCAANDVMVVVKVGSEISQLYQKLVSQLQLRTL
jgi:hypothetical protein